MRVERGDTIEYLGAAYDDAGKPLRGRTGVVEEFYGKSSPRGRLFMMRVRFGSRAYDMSQEAPLRIIKHARRHHRSRYPSGQPKPRFRVGQTVKFRAPTHHGEPVSYGRVQSISYSGYGEQPLYRIRLPNNVLVLVHQGSLTAAPRRRTARSCGWGGKLSGISRSRDPIRHQHPSNLLKIGIRAAERAMRGKRPSKATFLAGERAAFKAIVVADPQAGTSTHKHRAPRYSHGVSALARRSRLLAQKLLWTGTGKVPAWEKRLDSRRDSHRHR